VDAAALFNDTATHTWGVQAVRARTSLASGSGIKVAVLDTGVDLNHPDLAPRFVHTQSFVPGESVQDGHGHGTHCIGTACGPFQPPGVRRYGVAHQSRIIAIKVLSNGGSGQESWILQGMLRAVQVGAQVISMSLGRARAPTDPSQAYTNAGNFALANKCIIVAAAGNSAGQPVGAPANSPSIMAVAAVDQNLNHAAFSQVGGMPNGGEINIAGPGVDVFSSVPIPKGKYGFKTGTSMATPHVAGCAALWAQTNANNRGMTLWKKLEQTARPLPHPAAKVGSGLVQSPVLKLTPPVKFPRTPVAELDDEEPDDANNGARRGRKRTDS
jgi:subtilisin family serine protease